MVFRRNWTHYSNAGWKDVAQSSYSQAEEQLSNIANVAQTA